MSNEFKKVVELFPPKEDDLEAKQDTQACHDWVRGISLAQLCPELELVARKLAKVKDQK